MRTRDELFDALDKLPRPLSVESIGGATFVLAPDDGERLVHLVGITPTEDNLIVEYFTALPAEEKYTP